MDITPITLAAPLVVIALVNLAKRLGLSGAGPLALVAVLLGIALSVSDYAFLSEGAYTPAGWYTSVAAGLILGLTAAGLYDVADKVGGSSSEQDYDETVVDSE